MLDIKLIATDIDGTILPRGGEISPRTRAAAQRCWARGIPFVIATGRWVGAIAAVQRDLGVEGRIAIVANGGAVVGPDGTLLREWFMEEADCRRVYDILRACPVMINSYVRNGLYRMNTWVMADRLKRYVGEGDLRIVSDDEAAFLSEGMRHVYKMEALTEDPALIAALRGRLEATGLSVTSASPRNLEIMGPGLGKGTALKWLAEYLGVSTGQCMAFGDNINDLEMLRAAGWPVAMGNAVEAVKAEARIVAPKDTEDGVAKVVFKEVLGEEWNP